MIRNAYLDAVTKNESDRFYSLIFTDVNAGTQFISNYENARVALIKKNSFIAANKEAFDCSACNKNFQSEIDFFLKNFNYFYENKIIYAVGKPGDYFTPACGSYWNQVKMLVCMGLCSGTGPGIVVCGWGCWCTFCSKSALGNVICSTK
jgi:hypothetical protein